MSRPPPAPAAQDPHELFDVVDEEGRPTGLSKPRDQVHRDGDWHCAVHVWVVLRGASGVRLVLQRRSLGKDTWPGGVDVAVGGHLRAGEGAAEALREAEEEIGLALGLADVVPLGRRAYVSDGAVGVCDREIQLAFAAIVERAFEDLRPDPAELAGLLALPLSAAGALYRGEVASVDAEERGLDGRARIVTLRREECVKFDDGYPARVLEAIDALLVGTPIVPFDLRLRR
jgi:isopentenyldiphosphate isomerase